MQSLKILLLEDEIITATDLKVTLEEAGHRITEITQNYSEAMASVKKDPPDLAILDIFLKNSSADGIATARELLEHKWMPVIYLTANSEPQTFRRAKETLPAAYLLKPFRHEELAYQVELAYYYFSQTQKEPASQGYTAENIFIKGKDEYLKIPKREILFVQANRMYCKIYLKNKILTVTTNLTYLSQYMQEPYFFRLSRSYIINLDQVESMNQNYILFTGSPEGIPIPSGSKKELFKILNVFKKSV